MQSKLDKYLSQSKKIWQEEKKNIEQKIHQGDYVPKIHCQKMQNQEIIWLNYGTIFSTMIPAQKWPQQFVNKSTAFVFQAVAQTKGRGQYTNTWTSRPGNIYLTLITQIDFSIYAVLPLITSSAIIETIQEFLPHIQVNCKWINDIFVKQSKVSGLLTKCDIYGQKFIASFGIGVNIAEAPFQDTTYLNKFVQKSINIQEFSRNLVYNLLNALKNKEQAFIKYKKALLYLNQPVKIYDATLKNILHQGIFKGINEYGNAILIENNQQKEIATGRMRPSK